MTRSLTLAVAAAFIFLLCAGCPKESGNGAGPAASTQSAAGDAGSEVAALPADPAVNEWLLGACKQHHIDARLDGGWITFAGVPLRLSVAEAPGTKEKKDMAIVQLEFRAQLPDGRLVVQPVVGWGKDRDEAVASAEASFLLGSFHAFVGAFVDPDEEHVRREQRTIGGRRRVVTFGDILTKVVGERPDPSDTRWHGQLMKELDAANLPPGTHWVDVYHGQVGEKQELEIQLDSRRWTEMEDKLRAAPWPNNGTFTSVRQFIIVQDPVDPTRPTTRPARTAA